MHLFAESQEQTRNLNLSIDENVFDALGSLSDNSNAENSKNNSFNFFDNKITFKHQIMNNEIENRESKKSKTSLTKEGKEPYKGEAIRPNNVNSDHDKSPIEKDIEPKHTIPPFKTSDPDSLNLLTEESKYSNSSRDSKNADRGFKFNLPKISFQSLQQNSKQPLKYNNLSIEKRIQLKNHLSTIPEEPQEHKDKKNKEIPQAKGSNNRSTTPIKKVELKLGVFGMPKPNKKEPINYIGVSNKTEMTKNNTENKSWSKGEKGYNFSNISSFDTQSISDKLKKLKENDKFIKSSFLISSVQCQEQRDCLDRLISTIRKR